MTTRYWKLLTMAAVLGTGFQIGHFIEHAVQAHMWLFVDRSHAWMSGLAMGLTMLLNANMAKGMEVLHLLGNLIFLLTLVLWVALKPGNIWMRRAFYVEAFHLSEHIALTSTVFLYGHAVGWSTAFGFAPAMFGHDGAVGYRVLWHFGMNLIPSVFMLWGMIGKGVLAPLEPVKHADDCCCPGWDSRGTDAL